MLLKMGSGARSLGLLGITDEECLDAMTRLCRCMEEVGKVYGVQVRI